MSVNFLMQHKVMALAAVAAVLLLLFYYSRKPSLEGQWNQAQQRLPHILLTDRDFTVRGVRDFRYDDEGKIVNAAYIDEVYAFADLKQLWFGLSHFGGNGLAHAFMSFEFSGDRFLVLSIEARLEVGQRYRPSLGLLRRYEKIYVLATESDVIGLRTHSRGERVLLYPIQIDRAFGIDLLKQYLSEAQSLQSQAEFYNTVVDNCLTGLLSASDEFSTWDFITDFRILLPGRSDEVARELGLISRESSLAELRETATIDPRASNPDSPEFSRQIRSGWSK